jgi:hypothetical protein
MLEHMFESPGAAADIGVEEGALLPVPVGRRKEPG